MTTPTLIVIDIQNDYFPGGNMALSGPEAAAANAQQALQAFREHHWPVVIVQHLALSNEATFFRPGTKGAELYAGFEPLAGEAHLIKHYPNAFRDTELGSLLNKAGTEHLVICGMMTHMCIDTSTRAAADAGFRVTLLGDATATRSLGFGGQTAAADQVQIAYLAALNGSFARVTSTREWLTSLPD